MFEKKELTAEELEKKLREGDGDFQGIIIKGGLVLKPSDAVVPYPGIIKEGLNLGGAIFEDDEFAGVTIKSFLDIRGVTIEGRLNFSFEKPPSRIYVDEEMAERVHWAAPTIPLVVVRKKQ